MDNPSADSEAKIDNKNIDIIKPSILDHMIDDVKKTPIIGKRISSINIKNRNKLTEVVDLKRKINIKKKIEKIEKPINREEINPNGLNR